MKTFCPPCLGVMAVLAAVSLTMARGATVPTAASSIAVIQSGFIADQPPTPSCHASTIAETPEGLVSAWFGGSKERAADVAIYVSRLEGGAWSAPTEVTNGVDEKNRRQYPCWNPVLFQRRNGVLLLFYKVGPSPSSWWSMLMRSKDGGKTWEAPVKLKENVVGPVRNKPLELADGSLLCGASTEDNGWRVHVERSFEPSGIWEKSAPVNTALEFGAIQPTLIQYADGRLQMLCRTKQGRITEAWSEDKKGMKWSRMVPTRLPNPNSAIDAVKLADEQVLLVYNHTAEGRCPLNVAVAPDGRSWQAALTLESEPGEYSYPAVIQSSDGRVHITYTWKRQKIKHVVLDPTKLSLVPMPDGQWPK